MKREFIRPFVSLLVLASQGGWAIDAPVQADPQQNQSLASCIEEAKNRCLRDMCINTEELNCPEACQTRAKENCKSETAQ